MASNQEKLNNIHWPLATDDGREELRKWIRDSVRSVLSEAGVLDTIALAVLKRECDLRDPSGLTDNIVKGKTTLASKINWQANLEAKAHIRDNKLADKLDALIELLTPTETSTKEEG